jgi:hypothetical protein
LGEKIRKETKRKVEPPFPMGAVPIWEDVSRDVSSGIFARTFF